MTHHPALTVSRSLGSAGTEAGFLAARELGWRFCDRRILRMAAQVLGARVADLGHQEERPSGYLDQLLSVLAFGSPEAPYTPLLELPRYGTEVFAAEREVMLRVLEAAPSVLVGRGGFFALRGRPGTVHVRIHSGLDFRIQNLVSRGKAVDAKAARQAIEASDRNRSAFIREVTGLAWDDPGNFHLVLDPSQLGLAECVLRMVAACGPTVGAATAGELRRASAPLAGVARPS